MCSKDTNEDSVIREAAYLAAQARMPSGERMIDRLIGLANVVRAARKARFPMNCVTYLEDDMIAALEDFYRRAERYRSPT